MAMAFGQVDERFAMVLRSVMYVPPIEGSLTRAKKGHDRNKHSLTEHSLAHHQSKHDGVLRVVHGGRGRCNKEGGETRENDARHIALQKRREWA